MPLEILKCCKFFIFEEIINIGIFGRHPAIINPSSPSSENIIINEICLSLHNYIILKQTLNFNSYNLKSCITLLSIAFSLVDQ